MSAQQDKVRRVDDPYVAFLFSVELASGQAGGFSDVSGLNFESEVETLRVGGVNDGDLSLAGPGRSSRLVLKRGLADRSVLWTWYLQVMGGSIARQNVTVTIRGSRGEPRHAWTFKQACPVKWTGPELRAASSAVGFESIELIHRGLLLPEAANAQAQGG